MKRTTIMIALATLFVAQIAAAQMMGSGSGSHHGTSPAPGTGSGGMNGGMSSGDMGGAMAGGMSHSLTVGTDGVIYTLRTTTSTSTTPSVEVVSIRPSGTIAWTAKVDGRMTRLDVAGDLVLVASGYGDMGMDGSTADDDTSTLTALSAASGSVQWQLAIDGVIGAIEPFSGGVYAVIIQHGTTTGGTGMHGGSYGSAMKRTIAAIDTKGKLTWKIDLN